MSLIFFTTFITLVYYFCITSTDANFQDMDETISIYIHITVSPSVDYVCGSDPRGTLVGESGSTIAIGVKFLSNTVCHAVWRNLKGAFPPRDAIYGANYIILFLLVKPDLFNPYWTIKHRLKGLIGIIKEEYSIDCMMISRCVWNVLLRYSKGWRFMHFIFG